jgi:predicted RecA/RadA family phage recombinase
LLSGTLVLVGSIIGVAATDAANGAQVELTTQGVFNLPKITTDVVTQGAKLYWNAAGSNLTITPGTGSKPLVGLATKAAGNGVTTVECLLMLNDNRQYSVSAIDSQDVARFFEKNAAAVNRGVAQAVREGGDLVPTLSSAMNLQ